MFPLFILILVQKLIAVLGLGVPLLPLAALRFLSLRLQSFLWLTHIYLVWIVLASAVSNYVVWHVLLLLCLILLELVIGSRGPIPQLNLSWQICDCSRSTLLVLPHKIDVFIQILRGLSNFPDSTLKGAFLLCLLFLWSIFFCFFTPPAWINSGI